MTTRHRAHHAGLSLVELMLSLIVTALIAGAISGMMSAVTTGVSARRDSRSTMVRASAAAARLSAYVGPSRCVLDVDGPNLVLWLQDSRRSDTVHATEARWLRYDAGAGTLDVHFVALPKSWTQVARDLVDREYAADSDWNAVLSDYDARGWTASMTIVDGLEDVSIATDATDPLRVVHLTYDLALETSRAACEVKVAATIRLHQPPK